MIGPIIFVLVSFLVVFYGLGGPSFRSAMRAGAWLGARLLLLVLGAGAALGALAGIVYLIVRVVRLAWGGAS